MTLTADGLGALGDLGTALGLLRPDGAPNSAWFRDPVGGSAENPHGLATVMTDAQREALLSFADDALGAPERSERGGATWLPLLRTGTTTVSAVVEPVEGEVRLGLGVEHASDGVTLRLGVRAFRVPRTAGSALSGGGDPPWLLLGRPGGRVDVALDAALRDAPPPPGEAGLTGASLTLGLPTDGGPLGLRLELRDLRLPGAATPTTLVLDADDLAEPDVLVREVLELLAGLVRAQAGALVDGQPGAALVALLGLREVPGLPVLPLAALPEQGVAALTSWAQQVLTDAPSRTAWLRQLAALVGGTPVADEVVVEAGAVRVALGVRAEPGPDGALVVVPQVQVRLQASGTARAVLRADLLRLTAGGGGAQVRALPDLRAEVVLGTAAGAAPLLVGDPAVGALRVGLEVHEGGPPTFRLTLHDVVLGGLDHPLLDLSTPEAALDVAGDLVGDALGSAVQAALGADVGPLVRRLLGLADGSPALDPAALLADPLGALAAHLRDVLQGDAAAALLSDLRRLLTGATGAVPGTGTAADPWVLDLAPGSGLRLQREGDVLVVRALTERATPVLSGGLEVAAELALDLLRVDLAARTASAATGAAAALRLRRADGAPLLLDLRGAALSAASVGLDLAWSPGEGLRAALSAPGALLEVLTAADLLAVDLPLPRTGAPFAPDWEDLERAAAVLLARLEVPVVDLLLELVGWAEPSGLPGAPTVSAHLALADLVSDAPAALRSWLADVVLDCDTVRAVLGPLAALLSGGALDAPLGTGSVDSPWRCPVAGEPRAPGLAAWLDPPCPPPAEVGRQHARLLDLALPAPEDVAAALATAALDLPDVADLLVGRAGLVAGLRLLADRWSGGDGVVVAPEGEQPGAATVRVPGRGYEELVASGSAGLLLPAVLPALPGRVVHVGCEAGWAQARPDRPAVDATGEVLPPFPTAAAVSVRLPAPREAAAARADGDGVAEQAARLVALLTGQPALTLVAYGPAAAAAVRAAEALAPGSVVEQVVVVGAPATPVVAGALSDGLGADALRLLERLVRPGVVPWPDALLALQATPLQRGRGLVARSREAVRGDAPPAVAVGGTVPVTAVLGVLGQEDALRALAAVVADGLDARREAARQAAAAGGGTGGAAAVSLGLHVPALDVVLGGVLVGAGAAVELARLGRDDDGGLAAQALRGVVVTLRLAVEDGWLVGGPGAVQDDLELRWLEVRVAVPLDGREGSSELVLHEARAFTHGRERWVVRGVPGEGATGALPEVRVLLGEVVARLRAAGLPAAPAPGATGPLGDLLDLLGLSRDGGLDPTGLDRLLHDPETVLRQRLAAAPVAVATALRALLDPAGTGAAGSGSTVRWSAGGASAQVDLASGAVTAQLALAPPDLPPLALALTAGPAGASLTGSLGDASGLRLVGEVGAGTAGLRVELGGPVPGVLPLLPPAAPGTLDVGGFAARLLPAALARLVADTLRDALAAAADAAPEDGPAATAADLLDAALEALDLLPPLPAPAPDALPGADADGADLRRVRLPLALLSAPAAALSAAAAGPLPARAAALLTALTPVVAPGSPTGSWALSSGPDASVALAWSPSGDALDLALRVDLTPTVGGTALHAALSAGLRLGSSAPAAALSAELTAAGRGLRLQVAPTARVELLRAAPAPPLVLLPATGGLGALLDTAGSMVLPPVLDALAATGAPVGPLVASLGDALDLRVGGGFDGDRLRAFAESPAAALQARLPALTGPAVDTLAAALGSGAPGSPVALSRGPGGTVALALGGAGAVVVELDPGPRAVAARVEAVVPGLGPLALALRLSAAGVDVDARVGPAGLALGPVVLRPLLVVRAGTARATRLVALGLAGDDAAAGSVELRWGLDATPPALTVVTRGTAGETVVEDPVAAARELLATAVAVTSGVLLDGLDPSPRVRAALQGVVLDGTAVDPALLPDLLAGRVLPRLQRLAWNCATTAPPSLRVGGVATVALHAEPGPAGPRLGVRLTLDEGRRLVLSEGSPAVALEVDARWIDPPKAAGLTVLLLEGAGPDDLALAPSVIAAGVGVRVTGTAGPLFDLGGVALDGVAVHVYGEAGADGLGGGVSVQLDGLAVAPAASGGGNPVAAGVLRDATTASPGTRPAFSPTLAVQSPPGGPPRLALTAGPPPGPWWLVVQRQLGPLYLEQIGLDSSSSGGRLERVSLLFDGRLSLFGLVAEVDRLALTWKGSDLFRADDWEVDLQGLAVSAELAGASLAGGLLKGELAGGTSYVGMLSGRFGVYGLSLFGGYTELGGRPSFFVFGGVNGPIGGPPAFFVTGIGGGLGIDRGLRVPTDLSQFGQFPFLAALDPAAPPPSDPVARLRELDAYFPPQAGTLWFAAGLSFTSFALVDGVAVLAVTIGDGLEVQLLGLARMALPRPQAALVSIELALVARMSTSEGALVVRAQLTENSWLLYDSVRLTGGFAFALWWKGPLAGQFVLTIGGYHPDFRRAGYPEVPRVGLVWRFSPALVVKGGAYFALTSEALMAGVEVEVSADYGWAWARLSFAAHGIVYFDPFWFQVTATARISAGVKVDLPFVGEVSISVSVAASLTVEGPEFSGRARLEVGPCELEVPFGSGRRSTGTALDWPAFVAKYLEDAGGGRARALSAVAGRGQLPAATGGAASAPTSDGSAARPFRVFAEFELTLVTTVPATAWSAGTTVAVPVRWSDGSGGALGLAPAELSGLTSAVGLRLHRRSGSTWVEEPAALAALAAGLRPPGTPGSTLATSAFPAGAWGPPAVRGLPVPPVPEGEVLVAAAGAGLASVAVPADPGPLLRYDRVDVGRRLPLPLHTRSGPREGVLARGAAVTGARPAPGDAAEALARARAELSLRAPAPGALPAGLLATPARSRLALASLAGERAAPPLLGTLAGGVAAALPPAVGREVLDPPPAQPVPPVRPPHVLAHLTAGAGAGARAPRTTVADRRRARRSAPTLASVSGRLGTGLPLALARTAPGAEVLRGEHGETVVPRSAVPRTGLPGAARSRVGGLATGAPVQGLVAGLAPGPSHRASEPAPLRAGDVVVLRLPDAGHDAHAARPALTVRGAARVLLLRGDGTALLDRAAADEEVPVPAGTDLVAVQAGRPPDADGLLGWHATTRLARLGGSLAVGPGCTVTTDALAAAGTVGWDAAERLVQDAGAVVTRFARPVRTVVVALEGAAADAQRLGDLGLELLDAVVAPGAPVVVVLGERSVLLWSVVPDRGAGTTGVRWSAGGTSEVAGVLGGDAAPEALARQLAEHGVEGAAARLLAPPAGDCALAWQEAPS